VLINSPGGDVFDGIAIHNIIATEREKVDVEVLGLAASAASIIALAGKSLTIDAGGFFMIHNVWTFAMGDADDFRKQADDLDKISGELVNIYEAHSNLSASEIKEFMDDETWFTAAEAVEHGFADEQIEHEEMAASISVDSKYAYKHIPERFRGSDEGNKKPPENIREFEGLLRDAGYSRKQSETIAAKGFRTEQGDPVTEDVQGDPEVDAEETNKIEHEQKLKNTLLRLRLQEGT
jgi:ATP-dependent Clp protease protease subunit